MNPSLPFFSLASSSKGECCSNRYYTGLPYVLCLCNAYRSPLENSFSVSNTAQTAVLCIYHLCYSSVPEPNAPQRPRARMQFDLFFLYICKTDLFARTRLPK